MRMLLSLKRWNAEWAWMPFALPAMALSLLCLGRLLIRHGVGPSALGAQER